MLQARGHQDLAHEAGPQGRVVDEQFLDRHLALELPVVGDQDPPHATARQLPGSPVQLADERRRLACVPRHKRGVHGLGPRVAPDWAFAHRLCLRRHARLAVPSIRGQAEPLAAWLLELKSVG
jgi:hypothetical protein